MKTTIGQVIGWLDGGVEDWMNTGGWVEGLECPEEAGARGGGE